MFCTFQVIVKGTQSLEFPLFPKFPPGVFPLKKEYFFIEEQPVLELKVLNVISNNPKAV